MQIGKLVGDAQRAINADKHTLAVKLLKRCMLQIERAVADDDEKALEKALENKRRLEEMFLKDVMDFVEKK